MKPIILVFNGAPFSHRNIYCNPASQVRDTGIHLKDFVDEEPKSSRGPQKINEMQKRRRRYVYLS